MQTTTDWDRIHADYRTGRYTLRELSAMHGPSFGIIGRRAKREGWKADQRERIQQKTNELLVEAAVQRAAEGIHAEGTERGTREAQDAESAAEVVARINRSVIEGHRGSLMKLKALADELATELGETNRALGQVGPADIVAIASAAGVDAKAISAILDAAHVKERAVTASRLAEVYYKVIPMERRAHDLDREGSTDGVYEDWLAKMRGMGLL